MNTCKQEVIDLVKSMQADVDNSPAVPILSWLDHAQSLQRTIHENLLVTRCEVTTRFSSVLDGKAVDITVMRTDEAKPECDLFAYVQLYDERGMLEYEKELHRLHFKHFTDKLIKQL